MAEMGEVREVAGIGERSGQPGFFEQLNGAPVAVFIAVPTTSGCFCGF